VTSLPVPPIPWQVTGNHWVSLPCIHPANGALHAIGVLHRGARSAIEFAGHAEFLRAGGPALARPSVTVDGIPRELSTEGIAWERAVGWLPTFTCTMGELVLRGTVFAPHGRDADMAGVVYALSVENRGGGEHEVAVSLEGTLGHRQQRVRSPRPFDDAHRAVRSSAGVVALEGAARPGVVALALSADGEPEVSVTEGPAPTFAVRRTLRVAGGARADAAFYIAAGPERDGAEATVGAMRRRGWRELLAATRDSLQALEQTTGSEAIDRLLNRNLLFAYFYGVGRALDDAHFYLVRTRSPAHGRGVTVRDWEALAWTLPAVQLADVSLARELLLRACELHGYAPGRGVHYLDGTLFEPGFSLEGAAAYALAADRYIRDSADDQIVDEPVLADTLYLASDDVAARRDKRAPLYSTEVTLSGSPAPQPYTLHGNAVVAQALEVFRRTLDEDSAKELEDPEAVRAALRRHFTVDRNGKSLFVAATDLSGNSSAEDDPLASALWLPLYEAVARDDSTYRRTARAIGAQPHALAQQCARLLGPEASSVLEWMRRAPLDNGVAAEVVDEDGRAVANGGDAALSGLLAYTVWYAVHALGVRP
jgi:hypothetical protein